MICVNDQGRTQECVHCPGDLHFFFLSNVGGEHSPRWDLLVTIDFTDIMGGGESPYIPPVYASVHKFELNLFVCAIHSSNFNDQQLFTKPNRYADKQISCQYKGTERSPQTFALRGCKDNPMI